MIKTDNSHFDIKVRLRMDHLPEKKQINVLDCFAAESKIWNSIKHESIKQIIITSIEKKSGKNKHALYGDNLKWLSSMDLKKYDIIDLDAYGIPYKQIEIIKKKQYKGLVFVTAIQSGMGMLPIQMLVKLGYTKTMIRKIPTLFNRGGLGKLKNYLYLIGVNQIKGYFIDRKSYFLFNL